ncbi:MAG: 50S ribosomal protein L9 [Robiginitomaculum sp.]|nr:MAG: 50S ribosomal protein L9 [Robiginitomaculum sp.]
MEIVLLERVEKLGSIGDVVTVKDGFARNFLLPQGKALRANKVNIERFEREREAIEGRNAEKRNLAETEGKALEGKRFMLIRQAGESGHLYGSVSAKDIADAVGDGIGRSQVVLNSPIKAVGIHDVRINMHPEVFVTIGINVARTADEGERQDKGENVIDAARDDDRAADKEMAEDQAADMFDPDADIELETTDKGEEDANADDAPKTEETSED